MERTLLVGVFYAEPSGAGAVNAVAGG